jgi:aryl-alcohol dehydrogenase-like predicted oxidoreductase
MPLALDQGIGAVVWSPLAGGQLTGKIGRGRPAPAGSRHAQIGWIAPPTEPERLYAIVDALEATASEVGRSVSQVALAWLLRRPSVATLVIGARDEAQLRDNLGAVGFTLDAAQARRLDEASARPPVYPYWHQRRTSMDRNPPPVP